MIEIPDGFQEITADEGDQGGYIAHNGPYYMYRQTDGSLIWGFPTDHRHGNSNRVIHGAALIGFVDTLLGRTVMDTTGRNCATVSLTSEFIAGTGPGIWVEAMPRIKKVTRTMAFAATDVMAGDRILMSATGVFKLFEDR